MGGRSREKPESDECFEPLKEITKEIEHDHFKATLLDSELKLWQESQDMGHCIHRSYTDRIEKGDYIAYHIKCPRSVSRNGVTLGFIKSRGLWAIDSVKDKTNKNRKHERIDVFCEMIRDGLNEGLVEEPEKETLGSIAARFMDRGINPPMITPRGGGWLNRVTTED